MELVRTYVELVRDICYVNLVNPLTKHTLHVLYAIFLIIFYK